MLWKLAMRCRGESGDNKIEDKESAHGTTDDGFRPAKLFSIDRVFRNETMDATHLAEFHQVEGVVADRNLTLADLIGEPSATSRSVYFSKHPQFSGFMRVFFKKMGIENLRFKPAYNPYTEVRSFNPCGHYQKLLTNRQIGGIMVQLSSHH